MRGRGCAWHADLHHGLTRRNGGENMNWVRLILQLRTISYANTQPPSAPFYPRTAGLTAADGGAAGTETGRRDDSDYSPTAGSGRLQRERRDRQLRTRLRVSHYIIV